MAGEITEEVWKHAPQYMTGTRLLVLLRLANSSAEMDRLTSVSVPNLVRQTGASERSVYDALAWLTDKKFIESVPDEDIPARRKKYPTVTRYITECSSWWGAGGADSAPIPASTPAKSAPLLEQEELHSRGAESACCIKALKDKSFKSSSTKTAQPPAEPVETKIESKAEQRRRMIREADDLDPAKALFPEDQVQVAQRPPGEPGPDTGAGLALYFSRQYSMATSNAFIHWHNRSKLAGAFNAWMRDGVGPGQIRCMIDTYVSRPDLHDTKKLAWVDLLAKRALLGAEIESERLSALHEPETFNPDDWTSQRGSEPREMSPDDYQFDYEKWKRGQ